MNKDSKLLAEAYAKIRSKKAKEGHQRIGVNGLK